MDQLAAHWDPGTQKQTKQDSASAVNLNGRVRIESANVEGVPKLASNMNKRLGENGRKMSQGLNLVGKIGNLYLI